MHLRENWRDHVFGPFESELSRTGQRSVSAVLPVIGLLVLVAVVVVAAHFGLLPPAGVDTATLIGP